MATTELEIEKETESKLHIADGCMEMEGCVPPSPTSPTQPSSPLRPTRKKLDVPQTIMDIDYDLINSGIAILPGKSADMVMCNCIDDDNVSIMFLC